MAKLYFRYGAMNSGKSTLLLQVAYNYEERGMHVLLLKPGVDTKGEDEIVSRLGVRRRVDRVIAEETDCRTLVQEEQKSAPSTVYWSMKRNSFPTACRTAFCCRYGHPYPLHLLWSAYRLSRRRLSRQSTSAGTRSFAGRAQNHLPLRTKSHHEYPSRKRENRL